MAGMPLSNQPLVIAGRSFCSRLILGTGKFSSPEVMREALEVSGAEMVTVVVDAGLGAPSHASEAMEMGADAVLVNTAIAVASDPNRMATAFRMAVEAGRAAFESGLAAPQDTASPTSPLTAFLD